MTNAKVFKDELLLLFMLKIIPELNLERILGDCSTASPEFTEFIKPRVSFSTRHPVGSLLPEGSFRTPSDIQGGEPVIASGTFHGGEKSAPGTWHDGSFVGDRIPVVQNSSVQFRNAVKDDHRRVLIFPDTNIYISHPNFLGALGSQCKTKNRKRAVKVGNNIMTSPRYDLDQLTIVGEELQSGGLTRYNNALPRDLESGVNSVLSRCVLPGVINDEVRKFYDIASKEFLGLVNDLSNYYASKGPGARVGPVVDAYMSECGMKFANSNSRNTYCAMLNKLLNNQNAGNATNYVADKILALTNFGVNFFSGNDKSILLSADADLGAVEHIVYNNVLPAYIAQNMAETVNAEAPLKALGVDWANDSEVKSKVRQLINSGLNSLDNGSYRSQTNLIYDCRNGNVVSSFVHPAIRSFVEDQSVRYAKSYVVGKSMRDRMSPARVIKEMEANADRNFSQSYN